MDNTILIQKYPNINVSALMRGKDMQLKKISPEILGGVCEVSKIASQKRTNLPTVLKPEIKQLITSLCEKSKNWIAYIAKHSKP